MQQAVIKVQNLDFSYSHNHVLKGVGFTLYKGEQLYILGGNGSGKSTLLKVLLGLLKPQQGKIEIMGKPINQKIIARNFGYVPQYTAVDRDFPISVKEIISLECGLGEHCQTDVAGHLDIFSSKFLLERKLSDLSGGEFQKVLIARALVTNPKVLVMDEPTNNLDRDSINKLNKLITDYRKNGNTVVIVSHDDDVIGETAREGRVRVINLIEGKVEETS